MNRIDSTFQSLRSTNHKGIIAYLTAGDPDLETTEELVCRMAKGGVSMVELGVPFSDPVADGPVIQAASARALKNGVTLNDVLTLAGRVREKTDIPLLVMTYYNPVFSYGINKFAQKAAESGLDGIIVPDLPLEESRPLCKRLQERGLHYIYLIAPTSTPERVKTTVIAARGFIYCVSITGVTGAKNNLPSMGQKLLKDTRSLTDMPLALGFGISRPEQVSSLGNDGDAVIIGSAIVKLVEKGGTRDEIIERVESYLEEFKPYCTGL